MFGKSAGDSVIEFVKTLDEPKELPANAAEKTLARVAKLRDAVTGEKIADVRRDMQVCMQQHASVFRTQAKLDEGVSRILEIQKRANNIFVTDKSKVFNTAICTSSSFCFCSILFSAAYTWCLCIYNSS